MVHKIIKEKYPHSFGMLLLLTYFAFFITGCSDNDDHLPEPEIPEQPGSISYEVIKEYSFDELKSIENDFKKENIGSSLEFLSIIGNKAKYNNDIQMYAYKVALESDNIDNTDTKISLSGVLFVPPLEEGRLYRRIVALPYTYVMKDEAPTVRITEGNLDPHLIFWILEAYEYGYAVMIPDYPGFSDSYGQCYIPYVEKDPMVGTTVEYVSAAQAVLEKMKYEQKDGFVISGYSLGAYVSLQLTREFETNASYIDNPVDLLIVGGSPCNLLQEANLIRVSESMPQPYLFPLALLGYKKNGYQHLIMNDYLKEPYASEAAVYLDGQHDNYSDFFPKGTSDLFTDAFIKNESMAGLNQILEKNSVKPWINKCKFIMTHGENDETVYYEQARDFASEQVENGGMVSFSKTSGTHTSAGVWFFLRLYVELIDLEK